MERLRGIITGADDADKEWTGLTLVMDDVDGRW